MRFLADTGVSQHVAEWLRTNAHDAGIECETSLLAADE